MKISVSNYGKSKTYTPVEISNYSELEKVILSQPYSLAIFKDNLRNKENFLQTELVGLDFDEGVTLQEAEDLLKDYMYVIAPTKSHRKEKNGNVCDRFRVILFLSEPITDNATFEATWHSVYEKFPKIDKACKDSCRYFDPSTEVYRFNSKGIKITPVAPKPKEVKAPVEVSPGQTGKLAKRTLEFLTLGTQPGQKHHELYAAARDAHQNLYSIEWFSQQVELLAEKTGDDSYVDSGAIKTIEDAFNKEPKHDPRIEPRAFKLQKLGELYKDKTEVEWIVDELFSAGGVSLISGDPKAGKSTLVRQLIRDILRAGTFLGRRCKQGSVHYYAIEEQVQVLNSSFKRLGLTENDQLWVHVGDPLTDNSYQDFHDILCETKPTVAILDTVFDVVNVKSQNDYDEVKKAFRKVRRTARESGTHIVLIHHNGKDNGQFKRQGNGRILGSQAIAGGVDTILVFEVDGRTRLVTSSGRQIKPWHRRELVYQEKDNTYTLGPEKEEF